MYILLKDYYTTENISHHSSNNDRITTTVKTISYSFTSSVSKSDVNECDFYLSENACSLEFLAYSIRARKINFHCFNEEKENLKTVSE